MPRPRVYVSRPLPDELLARLRRVAEISLPSRDRPPSEAELLADLPGHGAAVVQLTEPIVKADETIFMTEVEKTEANEL